MGEKVEEKKGRTKGEGEGEGVVHMLMLPLIKGFTCSVQRRAVFIGAFQAPPTIIISPLTVDQLFVKTATTFFP